MDGLAALVLWMAIIDGVPEPAPTLADVQRFPPHAVALQQTRLAAEHRHWVNRVVPVDGEHQEQLRQWRREAYDLWYLWDDVRLVTDPHTSEECRLHVLKRLKSMLGPDWWGGNLPPPVPIWRYQFMP